MKKFKTRVAWALGALALLIIPFFLPMATGASGPITWRDLSAPVGTRAFTIPMVAFGVSGTTGTGIGIGGIVSAQPLNAGQLSHLVQSSSVATIQWPQRLYLRIIDGTSDSGVLLCATVLVEGYDQFGTRVAESVSIASGQIAVWETGGYTNTVFEKVTRVTGNNCRDSTNGTLTGTDTLTVAAPFTYLGFRIPFSDQNDFLSVCLTDMSATTINCAELNDGGSADVESAISVAKSCGPGANERCFTLNAGLANLFQGVTVGTGATYDVLQVQVRKRY